MKMALGMERTTPNYSWKLEADRKSVEVVARRRAENYLVQIFKMEESGSRICLREEVRGILNGNCRGGRKS